MHVKMRIKYLLNTQWTNLFTVIYQIFYSHFYMQSTEETKTVLEFWQYCNSYQPHVLLFICNGKLKISRESQLEESIVIHTHSSLNMFHSLLQTKVNMGIWMKSTNSDNKEKVVMFLNAQALQGYATCKNLERANNNV